MLQPSDHFWRPLLGPVQQVHVLLVLRAPELDAELQLRSPQSRAEGQNHLPCPAGHASFDVAQDTVSLLDGKGTLLPHVQPFIHQYPQVILGRAALSSFFLRPGLILGVAPTQVQGLFLGLVKPYMFTQAHFSSLSKSLWMVSLPLGVSTAPLILVSSVHLLRVHSVSLSPSLMKILNSTGPSMDLWGTPLVTSAHLNIEPLTTTFWLQPSNQFLLLQTVHPSNSYLPNLERRMLWGTVSKAPHNIF